MVREDQIMEEINMAKLVDGEPLITPEMAKKYIEMVIEQKK
jgi:hypothetical protein